MAVNMLQLLTPSTGGQGEDFTTLERRKQAMALAQELMKDSMSTAPIQSHWQGAAKLAQALVGGMMEQRERGKEAADQKEAFDLLFGGAGQSAPTGSSASDALPKAPSPSSSPMGALPSMPNVTGAEAELDKPRPQETVRTPFGVDIPVRTSSTLPEGLSERATGTFAPLVSAFSDSGLPVKITSAYRSPQHNAAVGGANGSQHMGGNALDISLRGMTDEQKRQAVALAQSQAGVNGFGYYPTSDSIHIDVREGPRAAWGSNYRNTSVGQGWPEWMTQQTRNWQAGQPAQRGVQVAALGGASANDAVPAIGSASPPATQPQQAAPQQMAQAQMPQAAQPQGPLAGMSREHAMKLWNNPYTRPAIVGALQKQYGTSFEYKQIDGNLVAINPRNNTVTEIYKSAPKPKFSYHDGAAFDENTGKLQEGQGFRPVTDPQERARYGIPATDQRPYQVGPGNKLVNPPAGITIDQRAESEYDKANSKAFADINHEIPKAAAQARSKIATLDRLGQILADPNLTTGAGAGLILDAKRYAKAIGIDVGDLSGPEAVRAIQNQFALELRNPSGGAGMPGAMSDKDREFLQSIPPGLERTPEGNRLIGGYLKKIANRSLEIERLRQKYVREHGRLNDGFYQELADFSDANPLFPNQPKEHGGSAPAEKSGQSPIDDLVKKYGGPQ